MVAELVDYLIKMEHRCSLAKISMVAELNHRTIIEIIGCSLAKISMVAEPVLIIGLPKIAL